MVKLSAEKSPVRSARGGNGKDIRSVELLLLRRFVVAKEEELVVHDRAAEWPRLPDSDGTRERRLADPPASWLCLLKYSFAASTSGRKTPNSVAMELVGAGLGDQADNARSAALIRSRRVLRLDARLFHAVFGDIERRNDGAGIVLGDAQRTAVDHVVDRADDRAVDGVGRDIHSRPTARNVGDLHANWRSWASHWPA